MSAIGFEIHDHSTCITTGLSAIEAQCEAQKLQLTAARRRVIEILLTEHRAMGAYEILDLLRADGLGSQPPVAYRALDFLVTHGFAHKIERLNAFVACMHPGESHAPAFLICKKCDSVVETSCSTQIDSIAQEAGFAVERTVIEALGLCPKCNSEAE